MRFEEVSARRPQRTCTMEAAAALVGSTERTVRRWSGRDASEGAGGCRLGGSAARRPARGRGMRRAAGSRGMRRGLPAGSSPTSTSRGTPSMAAPHFSRWTTKTLQAAGQVTRATRRGAPRKKRPRKPLPGMRLHQDGSTHEWVPGCQWDLSVTLDEAHRELFRRLGGGRRPAEPSSGRAGGPRDPGALPFPLHRPGLARLVDGGGDRRHEPSDAGTPRLAARGGRVVRRIRRRRGAGRRAPSGPCRTGCPKSGRGPGSRRGRRPTRLCPRGFSRPSFRGSARTSPRSCVCTRNGAWPRITPCGIRARVCRSPRTPIGSIREGHGAGARISGWNLGRVPWPSVSGALPRGWLAHRDWTSPTKSHWPDPRIGRPADRPS